MKTDVPRLSASNYSNSAPLIWSFLYGANRGKYELIMDNAPARSAQLLAEKRVDAALVPIIQYQRIADVLLVPNVCVGAAEQVKSVCLITKGESLEDVKTVSLDVSSRTSVGLTQIIFAEFLGVEPVYKESKPNVEQMLAESDCALLIGDPALSIADLKNEEESRIKNQKPTVKNHYRKFDLVEIWRKYTGFGFVFAMWMANAERIETAKTIDFEAIRDEGLNHLDEIVSNYQSEISLSRADFIEYLSKNISYTVDDSMRKGLSLYFELAHKHKLIETRKDLQFLD